MQAADQVGPKILFDLSQVETGFPVRYLHYGLESKARVRHPGIHLPKSDSGKYTIQARVSKAHPGALCGIPTIPGCGLWPYPGYVTYAHAMGFLIVVRLFQLLLSSYVWSPPVAPSSQ